MSHIDVTQGSIETLFIDLDDVSGNLNDLSTAAAEFEVENRSAVVVQASTPITTYLDKPMRAGCLINTTVPSLWPSERYFIYITFTNNPDTPVLGPFEFSVNP